MARVVPAGIGAGSTVIEATKMANQAMGRALGDNGQYAFAMMIFGDLLLTKRGEH